MLILDSIITCPHCGLQKAELMPTDACQYFYTFTNSEAHLKPKHGDCYVLQLWNSQVPSNTNEQILLQLRSIK